MKVVSGVVRLRPPWNLSRGTQVCIIIEVGSGASHFDISLMGGGGCGAKSDSINPIFWRQRRADPESNRGPSAYQASALPPGQAGWRSKRRPLAGPPLISATGSYVIARSRFTEAATTLQPSLETATSWTTPTREAATTLQPSLETATLWPVPNWGSSHDSPTVRLCMGGKRHLHSTPPKKKEKEDKRMTNPLAPPTGRGGRLPADAGTRCFGVGGRCYALASFIRSDGTAGRSVWVHFGSRWYTRAREIPYPLETPSPPRCFQF